MKFKKFNVKTKIDISKYPKITLIVIIDSLTFESLTFDLGIQKKLNVYEISYSRESYSQEKLNNTLLINIKDITNIPEVIELELELTEETYWKDNYPGNYLIRLILFTLTSLLLVYFYEIELRKKRVIFFKDFSMTDTLKISKEPLEAHFCYNTKIKKDYICVRRIWSR